MDGRVSFSELRYTLLDSYGRVPEPRYVGEEYKLPIVVNMLEVVDQYRSGGEPTTHLRDKRVVLTVDHGVRRLGEPLPPLEWFFKGIE